ncbi:hypothetical protein O9Z70_06515 [Devosia sp. YIM 151766]|uniref:hypothetical protein n=1 Tax=Devosia sp. YIM 151766 TaxID=3017325 RepID=UPI00255C5E2A|nr:hypothetical protein [Devosia sp. YIM 151766]WIY54170.1 hypothetical protein O9Z70_06515 [Devosia sp. YIM 151766]
MFQNVIVGWFARRALELGGLFGTLYTFYLALPPGTQDAINRIMTGNWQSVTLGALAPIAAALWGYAWSFRSTIRPQVVIDGNQVAMPRIPDATRTLVEESARTAAHQPRTLWERLTGK